MQLKKLQLKLQLVKNFEISYSSIFNYSLREKELQQHQMQFLDSNANPINETDFEIPVPNSDIENEDDDNEDDNANIITPEYWKRELRK